jgi:MFS family permease
MNAFNTVFTFFSGITSSSTVDKFGRRNLFLCGTFLTMLCYIPLNVIAAMADVHVAAGTGYAFTAVIFLYGIFWSFTWTPLQALHPAEILNNEIRTKGMAVQDFIAGLASFINTYATPVACRISDGRLIPFFFMLYSGLRCS